MDKFVGRNTEIATLAQLMISSSTNNMRRKVCLLHGIGGVGKSQLAAKFARSHQESFSAIFWVATQAFDIRVYLPEADQGSILITSRLAAMWHLAGSDIKLEPFDELQGELLLNLIVQKPLAGRLNFDEYLKGDLTIRLGRFISACEVTSRSSTSY